MDALRRNNVKLSGPEGGQAMIFAHGFGCDQNMWRFVTPAFEEKYRIVLFDHVGAGQSDPTAYSRGKYESLKGYATALPGGLIVKVNQTFLSWTGYRREDLVGRRRFQDLLTAGGRIFHETKIARHVCRAS
jgi:pimeloyl-ACP methyl ester carboxylesterase